MVREAAISQFIVIYCAYGRVLFLRADGREPRYTGALTYKGAHDFFYLLFYFIYFFYISLLLLSPLYSPSFHRDIPSRGVK